MKGIQRQEIIVKLPTRIWGVNCNLPLRKIGYINDKYKLIRGDIFSDQILNQFSDFHKLRLHLSSSNQLQADGKVRVALSLLFRILNRMNQRSAVQS